ASLRLGAATPSALPRRLHGGPPRRRLVVRAGVLGRRGGPLGATGRCTGAVGRAARLPRAAAGTARPGALGYAAPSDSVRRGRIMAELEREAAGSTYHAQALGRLGSLEVAVGDLDHAEGHLRQALAVDPGAARAHERLGLIALSRGRGQAALE